MQKKLHQMLFSTEHYVEVILILTKENEEKKIFNQDIVDYMNVSRASVSVAVSKLKKEGYICRKNKEIKLTEKGIKLGEELLEKHNFFYDLFINVGIDNKTAHNEACGIEHIISNDSFQKLKLYIDKKKQ